MILKIYVLEMDGSQKCPEIGSVTSCFFREICIYLFHLDMQATVRSKRSIHRSLFYLVLAIVMNWCRGTQEPSILATLGFFNHFVCLQLLYIIVVLLLSSDYGGTKELAARGIHIPYIFPTKWGTKQLLKVSQPSKMNMNVVKVSQSFLDPSDVSYA